MPLLSDSEYKQYMKYKKYNISYTEGKFKRFVLGLDPHQVIGILIFILVFLLFLDSLQQNDVTKQTTITYLILLVIVGFAIIK